MKNLLVYTNKNQEFVGETKTLAKIQIDNALDFFPKKDVILVTNFDFEYAGVKANVIPDTTYLPDKTNKIPAIVYGLQNDLFTNDTNWYHDFDAFQDKPFEIDSYLAFVRYGYKRTFNCGSFFFHPAAKPIIEYWNSQIVTDNRADEKTLTALVHNGSITEYEELPIEYNYTQIVYQYPRFDHVEPKVLHFLPSNTFYRSKESNLDIFMYGKSRLKKPIMSERLIEIFKKHGIK